MIFITGDTHGMIDTNKIKLFIQNRKLNKNDYLIIAGDVNCPDFCQEIPYGKTFRFWEDAPCTMLFVDGNHENFAQLNALPIEEWHGGKVHKLADNIIHLMRGQVYDIDGKTFFTFGGATSIDKSRRTPFVDWFPEEDCNWNETQEALDNLDKVNNKVDFIITHTIGKEFTLRRMMNDISYDPSAYGAVNNFLDYIDDIVEYKKWYFGHFHRDVEYIGDKKECLYNVIKRID